MEESVRRILRDNFHLVNVKPEWLKSVAESPKVARGGDTAAAVAELLLSSNLRDVCNGSFPPRISQKQNETIRGPYLAQIEELVNVAVPIENRYSTSDDSKMRMFKLCLHDGNQQFFAIEWKRVPQLSVAMTAGQKIIVSNVQIRRGLMLLSQENVKFLGGCVDQLQAAAVAQRKKTVKSLVPEEWMDELGDVPPDRDILGDDDNFEDAVDTSANQQRAANPVDAQPVAPQRAPPVAPQPSARPSPAALPHTAPPKQNAPSYFDDDDMDEVFATMELPSAVSRPAPRPSTSSNGVASRSAPVSSSISSSSSFVKGEHDRSKLINPASSLQPASSSTTKPAPSPGPSTLIATKRRKIDEEPEVLDLTNVSSEALATASPDDLDKLLMPSKSKEFSTPRPLLHTTPTYVMPPRSTLTAAVAPGPPVYHSDAPGDDQMEIDDGIEFQIEEEPEQAAQGSPPHFNFADETIDADPDALAALDAVEKAYSTTPFHYLCDIIRTTHSTQTPYKISAFVVAAVSQLDMTGGEYRLDVDIEDGTGKCRASLHDHIMESLIGMPANDFLPFYSAEDEETRKIASGMVSQCQDALRAFCGTMEITFFPSGHNPVITQLEFSREDVIRDTRRLIRALR
eukprot:TRINITY_DN11834_c0_g1_i1.p1 TRINITY_DN11834_c0_g1~~TRINITY_DN11834_c0_g1_i1.p1  ORF type:complete len:627 (+),score=118.33 TRINITY_DN11834_c0_g1_i1:70-1950(+)